MTEHATDQFESLEIGGRKNCVAKRETASATWTRQKIVNIVPLLLFNLAVTKTQLYKTYFVAHPDMIVYKYLAIAVFFTLALLPIIQIVIIDKKNLPSSLAARRTAIERRPGMPVVVRITREKKNISTTLGALKFDNGIDFDGELFSFSISGAEIKEYIFEPETLVITLLPIFSDVQQFIKIRFLTKHLEREMKCDEIKDEISANLVQIVGKSKENPIYPPLLLPVEKESTAPWWVLLGGGTLCSAILFLIAFIGNPSNENGELWASRDLIATVMVSPFLGFIIFLITYAPILTNRGEKRFLEKLIKKCT